MVEQEPAQTNRRRRMRLPWLAFGCLVAFGLLIPAAASATTFSYTGSEQTYTVPAGATEIHVVAVGGSGYGMSAAGGEGAIVAADLPVTAGTPLFVEVGGNGAQCNFGCPPPAFNGGGAGGGGGASDLRTVSCGASCPGTDASLASRLLVAGGGGAAGIGEAGGNAGSDGSGGDLGGEAGTQAHGGRGGTAAGTAPCTASNGADGCNRSGRRRVWRGRRRLLRRWRRRHGLHQLRRLLRAFGRGWWRRRLELRRVRRAGRLVRPRHDRHTQGHRHGQARRGNRARASAVSQSSARS